MNKIWFIGIGAIIVIGFLMLAFWLAGNNQAPVNTSSNGQNVVLPVSGSVKQTATNPVQGTAISVATAGGGTVQTKNFRAS